MNGADSILTNVFTKVGTKYGFETVNAEFAVYREFKVKWQRSYKWADFQVSDYLQDADESVLEGLATSIFEKITGETFTDYPQAMYDFVTHPDFSAINRPVYLRRSRTIKKTSIGKTRDLACSVNRLVDAGLISRELADSAFVSWTTESTRKGIGFCSVLMKVIGIPDDLDSGEIPDYVVDFAVYRQFCLLIIGFDPLNKKGEEMPALLAAFPRLEEAESFLGRIGISY